MTNVHTPSKRIYKGRLIFCIVSDYFSRDKIIREFLVENCWNSTVEWTNYRRERSRDQKEDVSQRNWYLSCCRCVGEFLLWLVLIWSWYCVGILSYPFVLYNGWTIDCLFYHRSSLPILSIDRMDS